MNSLNLCDFNNILSNKEVSKPENICECDFFDVGSFYVRLIAIVYKTLIRWLYFLISRFLMISHAFLKLSMNKLLFFRTFADI